jgi:hypothetical protein
VFIRIASRKSAAAPAQLDSNSYDGGIIVSPMSLLITNSIALSSDCNRYTNVEEDEQLALDGKVVVLGATLGISQRDSRYTLVSKVLVLLGCLAQLFAPTG